MKKALLSLFVVTSIISCSTEPKTKVVADNIDPHQFGFNYDSSANIDVIIATNKDMENLDSNSYKLKYADSVVFYDNGRPTNLAENLGLFKNLITNKIQPKISKTNARWGSKFNFKDGTSGDYVYQYVDVTFTKGDKSVVGHFFQADLFKDGKIIKEWNFYDPAYILPLFK